MSIPRNHHYVPQFYLKNFAADPEKRKLPTVAKHGKRAVWARRSIKSLGYERDLYVSMRNGMRRSSLAVAKQAPSQCLAKTVP